MSNHVCGGLGDKLGQLLTVAVVEVERLHRLAGGAEEVLVAAAGGEIVEVAAILGHL